MRRALLPLLSAALLLQGCAEKVVTIPGPEVVRLVQAKEDPRLLECMQIDLPSVDLIPEELPPEKVAAVLGVLMNRYKMGWEDCRAKLAAIRAAQP
jgi:hypothetical protein